MKSKNKIRLLSAKVVAMGKIVQQSKITLVDECDPNGRAEISLKNGVFLIEKFTIKPATTTTPEIILKDNK